MMNRKLNLLMIAIIAVCHLQGQGNDESERNMNKLGKQLELIRGYAESRDIGGLEQLVQARHSAWASGNEVDYETLMLTVVQILGSEPFDDPRQDDLASRYARQTLNRAHALSLDAEIKLVRYVKADFIIPNRKPRSEQWAQKRAADIKLWFRVWKRLDDSIDPNWDPNDMPQVNVPLPAGVHLPVGVAPEEIKDPQLRAEYEAALFANARKAANYNLQYQARKLARHFPSEAERYIVAAYSYPPYDLLDLQNKIRQFMKTELLGRKMVDAVTARMQERKP